MESPKNSGSSDGVLEELSAIKRLIVVALARDGVKQDVLASALGVSQASVSRMLPEGTKKAESRGKKAKR